MSSAQFLIIHVQGCPEANRTTDGSTVDVVSLLQLQLLRLLLSSPGRMGIPSLIWAQG